MSLDKAIKYGKERRKAYRGVKAYCCSCRNHGSCDYCKGNRLYSTDKLKLKYDDELREYKNGRCNFFDKW